MKKFWEIFRARNKEFFRDRGAMLWNFAFPVLVILGFGLAYRGGDETLYKVMVHPEPAALKAPASRAFLETRHVQFIAAPDLDNALAKLKRHQVDLVLTPGNGGADRYWVNTSAPKGYVVEKLLQASRVDGASFEKQTVEGQEIRYVDWLVSGLLAMNMMFNALFGVGYVIVRYRKFGVLRRLKASPLSSFTFLSAQVCSRYWLLITTTSIVYLGCNALIHFRMQGSYLDLFVVLSLGATCLISMGLLIASRISSEELAEGLLNMISWPMIFLSGVWFSLEGANTWVRKLALLLPLTHVIDAARAIMTEGASLAMVQGHVWALAGLSIAFLAIGSALFRWE